MCEIHKLGQIYKVVHVQVTVPGPGYYAKLYTN